MYDEAVSKLLTAFVLASLSGPLTFAQDAVVRVFADEKKQVHVLYKDGQNVNVAEATDEVGIDSVISKDGQTAGWLALYPDPDSSTAFAGKLVILKNQAIAQAFDTEQTFWSWNFYADDKQVAY